MSEPPDNSSGQIFEAKSALREPEDPNPANQFTHSSEGLAIPSGSKLELEVVSTVGLGTFKLAEGLNVKTDMLPWYSSLGVGFRAYRLERTPRKALPSLDFSLSSRPRIPKVDVMWLCSSSAIGPERRKTRSWLSLEGSAMISRTFRAKSFIAQGRETQKDEVRETPGNVVCRRRRRLVCGSNLNACGESR
jgi:hypothetical protein